MTDAFDIPVSQEMVETVTQFGVAGLMGVLWVWERMHSRQRDTQLTAAHGRIMDQRERLGVMSEMIRQNAETLERLNQTQQHLTRLMEAMSDRLEYLPPRNDARVYAPRQHPHHRNGGADDPSH